MAKFWKIDPFIYQILHFIRGHSYTKRLILLPMLAAHPCRVLNFVLSTPPPGLWYCYAYITIFGLIFCFYFYFGGIDGHVGRTMRKKLLPEISSLPLQTRLSLNSRASLFMSTIILHSWLVLMPNIWQYLHSPYTGHTHGHGDPKQCIAWPQLIIGPISMEIHVQIGPKFHNNLRIYSLKIHSSRKYTIKKSTRSTSCAKYRHFPPQSATSSGISIPVQDSLPEIIVHWFEEKFIVGADWGHF